jgi:hypothetical protein
MKKQSSNNQSSKTADKIANEMEEHGKKLLQTAKILRGQKG